MTTEIYIQPEIYNPDVFGPPVSEIMPDVGILDFDFGIDGTEGVVQRWARYSQERDWSRRHEEVVRQLGPLRVGEHSVWRWETTERSPNYVLLLNRPPRPSLPELQKFVGALGALAKLSGKWFRETFVAIAELEAECEFVDAKEVQTFLTSEPKLISYLKEGIQLLRVHFAGASTIQVSVVTDPDSGQKTIFANVLTSESSKDALARLKTFDAAWYRQLPSNVRASMNFDVALT